MNLMQTKMDISEASLEATALLTETHLSLTPFGEGIANYIRVAANAGIIYVK